MITLHGTLDFTVWLSLLIQSTYKFARVIQWVNCFVTRIDNSSDWSLNHKLPILFYFGMNIIFFQLLMLSMLDSI